MSFRRRITLAAAAAVAIAVALASGLTYLLTSEQLHKQVDGQLLHRGGEVKALLRNGTTGSSFLVNVVQELRARGDADIAHRGRGELDSSQRQNLFGRIPPGPDQVRGYQQVVNAEGKVLLTSSNVLLPVDAPTRRLAAVGGGPIFTDALVRGMHLRILAESFGKDRVVQFAQPLTEVDSLLARLRVILAAIVIGGIALAALLGRLVAGTALAPVRRLTETTEHVAVTRDLTRRITLGGEDELARLAGSFNAMLDALQVSVRALDASVEAQRQLVADASHELRTPITSLRTNIEILQARGGDIAPEAQRALLDEVVAQIEKLTLLINDIIDLGRGEEPREQPEEVRLDLLVRDVVERFSRRAGGDEIAVTLEPTIVSGVAQRLERAVSNLIDNAIKYSPPCSPVEVALHGGEIAVRDHGPGIPPEDLPHIFDRFFRGVGTRDRPGSGLGLAIVRQVADQHGGTISAEQAPGGGTLMRLRLPGSEPATEDGTRGYLLEDPFAISSP